MGCDIHAVFQAKRDGKWQDVPSSFEEDRDYFLFSWLANVRNGHGFAGIPTYTPIKPIAEPRGLPADFEMDYDAHPTPYPPKWNAEKAEHWMGDHSHSWLTADEILSAPPPDRVWRTGIVPLAWFVVWDGHTPPEEWSGGITGPNIKVADSPVDVVEATTHVRIYWMQPADTLSYFTDEINRLRDEHGEVRMVFGFDS